MSWLSSITIWRNGLDKWDKRFLQIAKEVSTWSKDPSTQIGAVAVKDRRIVSTGYNGFPEGVEDLEELYQNREEKYKRIVHAEMNVIYNASRYGISLKGCSLYIWGLPVCSNCCLGIIQSGINKIVAVNTKPHNETWSKSSDLSLEMFKMSNSVENVTIIKEEEWETMV